MQILKRNQLIILVMSLMLITAGYLNFTTKTVETNANIATNTNASELGDAKLVDAQTHETQEEQIAKTDTQINETKNDEQTGTETNSNENKTEQTSNNASTKGEEQYFIKSKLERETMYSQLLETYQEIYNNASINNEQKTETMKEISSISKTKNGIMISENLIMAKGIEDLVIFVNTNSVSAVIKAKELSPEQIAQIQNIISRELEVGIETIHISNKY